MARVRTAPRPRDARVSRGWDHLCLAHRGDDDVGAAHVRADVGRARVAHGHGGVHRLQHMGHGHAHDVAASQHDDILAADLHLVRV